MAYQTGTASDQTDLMNKLQTFAVANGFTLDNYDSTNRFVSISRPADNVYVTFYWDGTHTLPSIKHWATVEPPWKIAKEEMRETWPLGVGWS